LLTDHLKPGHLTYMRIEAEAPSALPAFLTFVSAHQAWRFAMDMTEQRREASGIVPRNSGLTQLWQEAQHAATTLATARAETMRFLATMLRRHSIDFPDEWARIRLSELETEASDPGGQAA
jgi:hypothetical protein